MGRMMQIIGRLTAGSVLAFSLVSDVHAQTASSKPNYGTYWLQSCPVPYPFDPYGGLLDVKTVDEKNHIYVIEDTPEDYAALQEANKSMAMSADGPLTPDGAGMDGGGPLGPLYAESDLWLEMLSVTPDPINGNTASLLIHTPESDGVYDLFATADLGSGNWTWILRTEPGETNLVVTNLFTDQAFFILGRTNDTDIDSLTDAYERLVSHTSSTNPDTDGDGLSDSLELELGFDPNNAYSQDANHVHKDGAWYLTAVTAQAGTRAQLDVDWYDSFYDPNYEVTVMYFAVSGITNSDQHHIYIRTPSLDPHDTNAVWQDMFFDFGYYDLGFDDNTGTHWYETAWFGVVPTNTVFAALDSQDRDSDGLQDGYEILAAHTTAGATSSDMSGEADGDVERTEDGLSNSQKWQYGLNPAVATSTEDSTGSGMPDWFQDYVKLWFGVTQVNAWDDLDGDAVPNIVEFETGSDPTIRDNWVYMPHPSDSEDVSLNYQVPYGDADGPYYVDENQQPHGNEFFVNFGSSSGALGLGGGMGVLTSGEAGPGVANVQFETWPLDEAYNAYATFYDEADESYPGQFQKLDPDDASLYRNILFQSTHLAKGVWAKVNKDVLNALKSKTLEYIHAVSVIRIHREYRRIQYYQYLLAHGGNRPALLMRIQRSASIIHTEYTKVTAVHIRYVTHYPNLNWIGRGLRAGSFLACGASWYYNWPALMDYIRDYKSDVRNHRNYGAADILSSQIQSMLQDLPGLPTWITIGLDPTIPIFSLNGPLGWYDGY